MRAAASSEAIPACVGVQRCEPALHLSGPLFGVVGPRRGGDPVRPERFQARAHGGELGVRRVELCLNRVDTALRLGQPLLGLGDPLLGLG